MKKFYTSNLILFLLSFIVAPQLNAQTTFWTENFSNGCASLCTTYTGTNGTWTIASTGTNGSGANNWFFSSAETGSNVGACSSTPGSDPSLHIGNTSTSSAAFIFCPAGDCGAAYDDSSPAEITNKRAESPTINCTGYSTISLTFNYIENGELSNDDGTLWYYDGTLWALLSNTSKTIACGGFGSTWTTFSVLLPPSANNNPNVKIGFGWANDGDGTATDPSYAIDDITLSVSSVGITELASGGISLKTFPNPFNGIAMIELALFENEEVKMEIYDAIGNKLITMVNEDQQAGTHKYVFDASDNKYSSGIYYLRLKTKDQLITRKLVLIK
jgi:hypothetical protein